MGNGAIGSASSHEPLPGTSVADSSITRAEMAPSGSNYSFVVKSGSAILSTSDLGYNNIILFTASATFTIPVEPTLVFPVGTQVNIAQVGADQVTIAAESGVSLYSEGNRFKTRGQYAVATVVKIASTEWLLFGNLSVV